MPWETETGLKDDFFMRTDSAYFENWEKGNDAMTLVLVGADFEDPEGELITLRLTCGNGWESADGSDVVHDKGKERFNKNTKVGKLVDRIVELLDADQLATLGEPTQADTYMNWVCHWVAEYSDYKVKDRETGEWKEGKSRTVLPTEIWLTEADYQATHSSGNTSVKVDTPSAKADTTTSAGNSKADEARRKLAEKKQQTSNSQSSNGSTESVTSKLNTLAKSTDDHATFAEKALDWDEVASDDDLVMAVMNDGPDGLWALARA